MDKWSRRVAHISEEIEGQLTGEHGDTWYTGLFYGFVEGAEDLEEFGDDEFEDLPLEEAVAWGRERADVVLVKIGGFDAPFSAGMAERDGCQAWPPPDMSAIVRRRPPHEAWKDSGGDPSSAVWRAQLVLRPPAIDGQRRAEYAAAMADLAARAHAVFWDGQLFDGFIEDMNNSTNPSGAFGTWNKPVFLMGLRVTGAGAAAAEEAARQRVQPLPVGWSLAYVETKPDI